MTTLLCSSPSCHLPGIHRAEPDEGHDDTCRGCQPARAADGLYLCGHCLRRLERDPWTAARLHAALGLALVGGNGRHGPGGGTVGLEPDAVAMEARGAIRATLASLCRLIAEERGFALPDDTVIAMARYLTASAQWLAAHPAAGEHAQDLRDIVGDGRSWAVAYPVSGDRTLIGVCNRPRSGLSGAVADAMGTTEACGTPLWHREGEGELTCPACGTVGTVQWWRWEMCSAAEAGEVVDVYAAAAYLSWRWCRVVEVWMVRQWGRRAPEATGLVCTVLERNAHGRAVRWHTATDERGRVLFVLDLLERYATKRWGEAPDTLMPESLTA